MMIEPIPASEESPVHFIETDDPVRALSIAENYGWEKAKGMPTQAPETASCDLCRNYSPLSETWTEHALMIRSDELSDFTGFIVQPYRMVEEPPGPLETIN